jgi:ACS family D-galactonate transporter-like MFS transporter
MQIEGTNRKAWLIVAMLFSFMLINFADKAVLGLSAVSIMKELNLSHAQFGAVGSSFFAFFSIGAVLVGFLVNRVQARWVLLAMALIWSVAQLPMLFALGLPFLVFNRVLLGAGEGPAYPVALHATYKWFPNERRSLPSGFVSLGGAVGVGIVAPLVAWVIAEYSWHVAFFVLGLAGLAWALVWMAAGAEGPLTDNSHGVADGTHIPYGSLLTCRTVLGAFIIGFAAYWLLTLAFVWLPAYLNRGMGFTMREASWIVTLPSLCQILTQPAICIASERLNRRGVSSRLSRGAVASGCVLLAGLLAAVMPFAPGTILPILCVAIAFSIGSVVFALGHVVVAEVTPARQRGAMLGINNAVATLAGVAAPVGMGMMVDVGTSAAAGFQSGFLITGLCVALAGLAGMLLINPEADRRRFAQLATLPGDTMKVPLPAIEA